MRKLSLSEFIDRSNNIHLGRYTYENSVYVNVDTKIEICCNIHGPFLQRADHHMSGRGCPNCCFAKLVVSRKIDSAEFFLLCGTEHNNFYDYSLAVYENEKSNLEIICPEHGNFIQRADHHKRGSKCPMCKSKSRGERKISSYLIEQCIPYEYQKSFPDLRNPTTNGIFKFDFFIPDKNLIIEYDGIQHFKPVEYFGGQKNLEYVQYCDKLKTEYCVNNSINLHRISYNDNILKSLRLLIATPNLLLDLSQQI